MELPHAADVPPAGHFSGLSTGFRRDGASWRSSGDITPPVKQKRPGVLGPERCTLSWN